MNNNGPTTVNSSDMNNLSVESRALLLYFLVKDYDEIARVYSIIAKDEKSACYILNAVIARDDSELWRYMRDNITKFPEVTAAILTNAKYRMSLLLSTFAPRCFMSEMETNVHEHLGEYLVRMTKNSSYIRDVNSIYYAYLELIFCTSQYSLVMVDYCDVHAYIATYVKSLSESAIKVRRYIIGNKEESHVGEKSAQVKSIEDMTILCKNEILKNYWKKKMIALSK